MTPDSLWNKALGEIELKVSQANFHTWLSRTHLLDVKENEVIIGVPNVFTQQWLQNKFHYDLIKIFEKVSDKKIKKISYEVSPIPKPRYNPKEDINKSVLPEIKEPIKVEEKFFETNSLKIEPSFNETQTYQNSNYTYNQEDANLSISYKNNDRLFKLNPIYTFKNFVVGKSNSLAHAAALSTATRPGQDSTYNPLFIYGGVGLGKTHLIQAIGNVISEQHPNYKILYLPCETFVNDYVFALRHHEMESFKNMYRRADALLIDDIQFLTAKETSQEEFFHTFNALHQNNKQIILTADRPPKMIPGIEDRLISRFQWGMTAEISMPDLETRIAFLKQKAAYKNFKLDEEIINYLAANIYASFRELEGALNKIKAYQDLQMMPLHLDNIKRIVTGIVSPHKNTNITARQLIETVTNFYDISMEEIQGKSRKKELVVPRQIAMYLLREDLHAAYPNIAEELGGRDHTTAIHAHRKIAELFEEDEKIRQDISLIRQRLYTNQERITV